jgi:hypothetical protein
MLPVLVEVYFEEHLAQGVLSFMYVLIASTHVIDTNQHLH